MNTQADRLKIIAIAERLPSGPSYQVVVIEGDPISKARPRFSHSGHPYTPHKTVIGEKRIAASVANVAAFRGNVAVVCLFYRKTLQRIDVDNCLKAVLDGCTRAGIWRDDSQVTALVGLLEHDRDNPRTLLCFSPHASSMARGDDALVTCEACNKTFSAGGQRRDKARWCSRECRTILAEPLNCLECGIPFKRRTGSQKLCGRGCQTDRMNRLARHRGKPKPRCSDCGSTLSRHGYVRCRACFLAGGNSVEATVSQMAELGPGLARHEAEGPAADHYVNPVPEPVLAHPGASGGKGAKSACGTDRTLPDSLTASDLPPLDPDPDEVLP